MATPACCQMPERQRSGNCDIPPVQHLRRIAHSSSDLFSRINITKTKRSKAPSARISAKVLFSADVAGPSKLTDDKLSACSGMGVIIWIAILENGLTSP